MGRILGSSRIAVRPCALVLRDTFHWHSTTISGEIKGKDENKRTDKAYRTCCESCLSGTLPFFAPVDTT